MSTQRQYSPEHRESAVRMVFESVEPGEALKPVCVRVAPLVDVRPATLYSWAKQARPTVSLPVVKSVTVGDVEAENKVLRKELREVKRANEILKAATAFFGAEIDRQSRR